jgi:hypothetical protein
MNGILLRNFGKQMLKDIHTLQRFYNVVNKFPFLNGSKDWTSVRQRNDVLKHHK